ncbi:MAG: cupin domain-containing protein [Clostridia bacterium]|nr:cupin domain-containing protein [Clostridia bacterium]
MKRLIAVNDIKALAGTGKKALYVEPGTIITPAARDAANEMGISINFGREPEEEVSRERPRDILPEPSLQNFNPELIAKIVREVIARLPQHQPGEIIKEVDSSGFSLVRGSSLKGEKTKEILIVQEGLNMCAGLMSLDRTSCRRSLPREEIGYIVEGTLEITVNGKIYRGKGGDVFYIPAGSNITFSSPDQVRVFFVTHPANRSQLSC